MAKKNWIKNLSDGFYIRVFLTTVLGNIVDFSVVLIYQDECIARYDTAHGFAHLDRMGKRNALIEKERYDNLPLEEAFTYALNDLSQNAAKHLDFYEQH
jgi:hypothetical protein